MIALAEIGAVVGREPITFDGLSFFGRDDAAERDFFAAKALKLAELDEPTDPPLAENRDFYWREVEPLTDAERAAVREALIAEGFDPAESHITITRPTPDAGERLRSEVDRLAKLERIDYVAERRTIAKTLGVPAGELDKLIEAARPKSAEVRESLAPPPPGTVAVARQCARDARRPTRVHRAIHRGR